MSATVIMSQLGKATECYDDWRDLTPYFVGARLSAGIHLAIIVEPFLGYILDGKKTIESRFSKNQIAPHHRIAPGDLVLLKAGPVVASFRASSVEFVELDFSERARLRQDYSDVICADEQFWATRQDKRYPTLVGISDVKTLTPLTVAKRDRRGWLVLRAPVEQLSLL